MLWRQEECSHRHLSQIVYELQYSLNVQVSRKHGNEVSNHTGNLLIIWGFFFLIAIRRTVSREYNVHIGFYHQTDCCSFSLSSQIERLTKNSGEKVPDSNRTQKASIYAEMGVLNAFVWKGYN